MYKYPCYFDFEGTLLLLPLTAAQTGPESVAQSSFTSGENQKLYINGDHTQTVGKKAEVRPEASPAWKKLEPRPHLANQTGEASIALSKDGATLYVAQGLAFAPYTKNNSEYTARVSGSTNTWDDEYKPSVSPQSSALSSFGGMKTLMYSDALALSVLVSLL
ncbi:hypothetical protein BGZ82_008173 [Podila clonocystis]|nr:hypothetical protein BGZ82_008173 [Podila clonocystis]